MAANERMDRFGVETMDEAEYRKKQDYVIANCKCKKCPSFVAGDASIGYCLPLVGTSRNIQWEKGCVCETCSIYKEYDLSHTFYCTRCSEVCQTLKTAGPAAQGT